MFSMDKSITFSGKTLSLPIFKSLASTKFSSFLEQEMKKIKLIIMYFVKYLKYFIKQSFLLNMR